MPTWQFDSHLNPNQTLSIPPEVANELRENSQIHVVLMTNADDENADWQRLAAEQFLEGYDSGDEIYDNLPEG